MTRRTRRAFLGRVGATCAVTLSADAGGEVVVADAVRLLLVG